MAQAAASSAGAIPPASVESAPPAPSNALREFSEALFETQDKLSEGLYIRINEAAVKLHRERAAARISQGSERASDLLQRVRNEVFNTLHELQCERDDYQEQLQAATIQLDKLRERRDFYAKCVGALKSVCTSSNIPDSKLLEAYDRVGIKARVLQEGVRKRTRDDEGVPVEVVAASSEGESDSE